MFRGICKLCLQKKDLCDSHYLPKSLYRQTRKEGGGDPIVMTPGVILSTSRQVRGHVFCDECEQLFSRCGENYSMKLVAQGERFPMRDRLSKFQPMRCGPFLKLPGAAAGIDYLQVAHFAVGLLWKGAVHSWQTYGIQTTQVQLLPDMESVRRYLLGEIPIPDNILVFVVVCLDLLSQVSSLAPFLVGGFEHENRYEMLVKGIRVMIAFSPPQNEIDEHCFVHSRHHPIFAADCHDAALSSARHFREMAHLAKNLPLAK